MPATAQLPTSTAVRLFGNDDSFERRRFTGCTDAATREDLPSFSTSDVEEKKSSSASSNWPVVQEMLLASDGIVSRCTGQRSDNLRLWKVDCRRRLSDGSGEEDESVVAVVVVVIPVVVTLSSLTT